MSYDNLVNHYTLNFELLYHHHFTISELNAMLPYERAIYIDLLNNYIEKRNQEIEQQNAKNRG